MRAGSTLTPMPTMSRQTCEPNLPSAAACSALRDVWFAIPGATVQVAGTYGLFTEAMAFDGTARMKATVSEAAGGGSQEHPAEGGRSALPEGWRGRGHPDPDSRHLQGSRRRARRQEGVQGQAPIQPSHFSGSYRPPFAIDPRNSPLLLVLPIFESSSSIAFHRRQRREHLAQHPDAIEVFLRDQQLFLPRAALLDVDGREDPAIGQLAIEVDLRCCRCP